MAEPPRRVGLKPRFAGERVRLGELITPAKVERCGEREFPVYSMTMHDGIVKQAGRFKKAIASKDTRSYKVVRKDQLVVGFPIDEGVIYIQNHDVPGIMSPAYGIWDIDLSRIAPGYLELALHSPQSMAYYADKMRGTTARRRTLTPERLKGLEIPLPNLAQQRQIVDTFQGIRARTVQCEALLSDLQSLIKSRFMEMFGDPVENPMGWPTAELGNSCAIVTGNTPSRKCPEFYGDHIEWVKTDNIVAGSVTRASEGLSELGKTKARIAPAGSVLMACIAGSINSIGKVGLLDRDAAFNQQINAVIPGSGYDSKYLSIMLGMSKDYLCCDVNHQLKGILNKTALSAKAFPLPPLSLQREFAEFAARADKLESVARQSIEKLQMLYDSLAQDYFGMPEA